VIRRSTYSRLAGDEITNDVNQPESFMADAPQSFWDRLKQFPLWKWGLMFIFSGLMVSMLTMSGRPTHRLNAKEKAAVYGQLTATSLIVIVGIVLIIMHFVRRNRKP
jgi:hypothetical protein